MKTFLFLLYFGFLGVSVSAQVRFMNGDFENTNATGACVSETNINNETWNRLVPNTFAFGVEQTLDIIHTSCDWGPAEHGNFFAGVDFNTSRSGNIFSFTLSQPLKAGSTYSIAFADKGHTCCTPPGAVQLTLSTKENEAGTVIFSGSIPTTNTWNTRKFSFTAPNNGQFITVSVLDPGYWTLVDNFRFTASEPEPTEQQSQFKAYWQGNQILLSWSSTQENTLYSILEHSFDGIIFEPIASIPKNRLGSYTFIDTHPLNPTSLYRIIEVNPDNIHHYRAPVSVYPAYLSKTN